MRKQRLSSFNDLSEDAWLVKVQPGRGIWILWYPKPLPLSLHNFIPYTNWNVILPFCSLVSSSQKVILSNLKIHLFYLIFTLFFSVFPILNRHLCL